MQLIVLIANYSAISYVIALMTIGKFADFSYGQLLVAGMNTIMTAVFTRAAAAAGSHLLTSLSSSATKAAEQG